jgi:hypothetical protein
VSARETGTGTETGTETGTAGTVRIAEEDAGPADARAKVAVERAAEKAAAPAERGRADATRPQPPIQTRKRPWRAPLPAERTARSDDGDDDADDGAEVPVSRAWQELLKPP